jgi:hypothetical protein
MKITGNSETMKVVFDRPHDETDGVLADTGGIKVVRSGNEITIKSRQSNLQLTDDGLFILAYPAGYKHGMRLTPNMKQIFRDSMAVGYEMFAKTRRGFLFAFKEANE